jgi:hypothetical protein
MNWKKIAFSLCAFAFSSIPAFGFPDFLEAFRSDPYRNPAFDGCNTCHMSAQGGDERNVFGQAFERGGETITPLLRAQFPDRFTYPVSSVGDMVVIHFSDPENRRIVVESGSTKALVDVAGKTVDGRPAGPAGASGAAPPAAPPAAPAAVITADGRSGVRVDEYAREGAFFGSNVVNLPNGKPLPRGGIDFFIGHRFLQDIDAAGIGGLFGFDSSAVVAYGVRVGLTDRISFGFLRSNLAKTTSLASALQVSRQKGAVPVTVQLRAGVDGKHNFGLFKKSNFPFEERQYSPFLQVVATRTFMDRVSVVFAPTFAFNTRNENTFVPASQIFGGEHDNTTALGLGAGIRFSPSASLVGEFIPRLHGFRGEIKDRPGVSIGLQKSTFRHTFELVVSRQEPMTTAQYAVQGTDTFRIGFNIFRRLR